MTAFGPFGGTAEVDLEDLGASGVFLLCGDTGAGKTTVLDAVCFALYGDLPSRRAKAKQLRSHFAPDGVGPQVVLEASFSDRRLRFTRSPAWRRAKRRGTGTTEEKAKVLVEERRSETWEVLAARPDEAGLLVGDLLGMTKDQFDQVVLLPQGQFDTFLSASAEDRQQVLTRLFATHRFEAVQRWLVERRTALRRDSGTRAAQVAAVLHHLAEAAGTTVPEELAGSPEQSAATGATVAWATGLRTTATEQRDEAEQEHTATAEAATHAHTALERERVRADQRRRYDTARADAARLESGADRAAADAGRVAAAERAAPVAGLADRAERTRERAVRAEREAVAALGSARDWLPQEVEAAGAAPGDEAASSPSDGGAAPAAATVAAYADAAVRHATVAHELLPHVDELAEVRRSLDELADRVAATDRATESLTRAQEAAETEVADTEERVAGLEAAAVGLEGARAALAATEAALSRHAETEEVERLVEVARERVGDAEQRRDQARTHRSDLRERRLLGMAAELACRVADGEGCPVCGSREHPSLAIPASGSPSPDDERVAQTALDTADSELQVAREELTTARTRLGHLREAADRRGLRELAARQEQHAADVAAAAEAAECLPRAREQRDAASARHGRTGRDLARTQAERAGLLEQREQVRRRADAIAQRLLRLLDDGGAELPPDEEGLPAAVRAFSERQRRAAEALRAAREALEARDREQAAAESADREADAAATAAGFADRAHAVAAVLPADRVSALRAELGAREATLARAQEVLADPAVLASLEGPDPDPDHARTLHDEAARRHAHALAAVTRARERAGAVERHLASLTDELEGWAPVRDALEVARGVAELAEGKGVHNAAAVSLSAYVLSARLSQVVAAANERLTLMSDGRYVLEHTVERAVGDRRGGLSLAVRDEWTDESRDPVTLSGGETFVVSLALALGLADVVTAESGGTRIDTLFVDEGFGSLDPDTLELVMDSLDDLREGGRVVGVVSHVTELRSRIGTQLVVSKQRLGSSLDVVHAAT
ncbi:hypothetical protein LUZ63_020581 [Rhynchospora breviuscula]|uniref:Rad50/SbcC-type AAA domain-containing protein n=1 Tax=Rhynchospora breviuscula TaxID=2022672 RepID=A0A9Q0C0R7_9POAL|nr:hypothetical protein LUZ63_020581 [Rhynchospora breviuscula]